MGIKEFFSRYKRLPYLPEDDVIVQGEDKKGEIVDKLYRASRYITEYYGNPEQMIEELFKLKIVSLELLSSMSGFSETIIQNIMENNTKTPDFRVRRFVEMTLGIDYYKKQLGTLNQSHCEKCKNRKKCGQLYYVEVVSCPKYKANKK